MTHPSSIEKAVVKTFRLLVLIRILLGSIAISMLVFLLEEPVPPVRLIGLGIFSLLVLYLYLPTLERRLQQFYLPIALAVAIVVPIVEHQVLIWRRLYIGQKIEVNALVVPFIQLDAGSTPFLNSIDIWIPFLFIPLVIIAWRYGFRSVIIFCVFTIVTIFGFYTLIGEFDAQIMLLLVFGLIEYIFVSLAIGYVIAHLNDLEKRQRHELEQANRKLLQHAIVLEQLTISQERNRLARELHDTLAHTLSGTTVQLEASEALRSTNPAKSQQLVQQSLQRLRSGLNETRRALEALRASPLDDLGLLLALHQLVQDYQQRTGWEIKLQLPERLPEISLTVEQILYRCMQEVLSNIDRHAAANKVTINVKVTETVIYLSICDDGRGFDVGKINTMNNRFGIIGMQERIEATGGLLKIDSQAGHGTTIHIEMRLIA
ncbi:MAG: sensor histidine kinase [Chloroflexota bacterium]